MSDQEKPKLKELVETGLIGTLSMSDFEPNEKDIDEALNYGPEIQGIENGRPMPSGQLPGTRSKFSRG